MPTRCNRGFYCRSYCLLNMFRASPLPSPHHTYEKSQTYLDTQTSKSVTNAATQLIKPTASRNIPPHDKSGVYCLTCKTCNLSCGSNQLEPEDPLPGARQVHKNQQSTIGLRPTHLAKSAWIWYISWDNGPAQAHPTRACYSLPSSFTSNPSTKQANWFQNNPPMTQTLFFNWPSVTHPIRATKQSQ